MKKSNNYCWSSMKKANNYCWLAIINFITTVFMVIFILSSIFPKSTIMENGDISVNVRGFFIDQIEYQEFETNVETLETNLVYMGEPVYFGESEVIISNEAETYIRNVVFSDGNEYKITLGEVTAYPRKGALPLMLLLYITVTLFILPCIFGKFT